MWNGDTVSLLCVYDFVICLFVCLFVCLVFVISTSHSFLVKHCVVNVVFVI